MTVSRTYTFTKTFTFDDEDADILEKMDEVYNRRRLDDRIPGLFHFAYEGYGKVNPHRIVAIRLGLDLSNGKTVDHIDINSGNNTRSNLRSATRKQQSANRRKQLNTSSEFTGVVLKRVKKNGMEYKYWVAQAWEGSVKKGQCNKRLFTKTFKKEEDAARYYDAKVIELGLDKPLNFPEEHQAA